MDEKRVRDFRAFVLKKDAYELERQASGVQEKGKRLKREQSYAKARDNFKRPTVTAPPGQDQYERKMKEMEQRYDTIRKAFAANQKRVAEALHDKLDRTKMVEYDIKSNKEANEE